MTKNRIYILLLLLTILILMGWASFYLWADIGNRLHHGLYKYEMTCIKQKALQKGVGGDMTDTGFT